MTDAGTEHDAGENPDNVGDQVITVAQTTDEGDDRLRGFHCRNKNHPDDQGEKRPSSGQGSENSKWHKKEHIELALHAREGLENPYADGALACHHTTASPGGENQWPHYGGGPEPAEYSSGSSSASCDREIRSYSSQERYRNSQYQEE
ncbi:hypothetical protein GCM10018777_20550 [Streptomyces albogriseolus]|nr:hypothetical protein GCM10018777_20550 [Streptomyces viridodiastaticus]